MNRLAAFRGAFALTKKEKSDRDDLRYSEREIAQSIQLLKKAGNIVPGIEFFEGEHIDYHTLCLRNIPLPRNLTKRLRDGLQAALRI